MKRPPEMSRAEFQAALKRNDFKGPTLFWFQDMRNPNHSYSGLFTHKGNLCRRATIAHLLRQRAETEAKAEAPK